jgi:hypothetical protein
MFMVKAVDAQDDDGAQCIKQRFLCVTLWAPVVAKDAIVDLPPMPSLLFPLFVSAHQCSRFFVIMPSTILPTKILSHNFESNPFAFYPTQTAPSAKQGLVKLGSGTKLDPCLAGLVEFT